MNTVSKSISNSEDVIDSRDVIERIKYLESDHEDCDDAHPENHDQEEHDELVALTKLQEEAEEYAPDWEYGSTLIRDSYFKDYAQELAYDIGAIDPKATWPINCIDWEAAADALKMDYTKVDFDGVSYWIR